MSKLNVSVETGQLQLQPDAIRKRMACQASQLMSSVMGYAIQEQGHTVQHA